MKKTCPVCNKIPIDLLFSMNKLWCFHCRQFYNFNLKPGQKSIHNKGLIGENISNSSNK